ncbi:MAG: ACT domain-containing protein [Planctomycetota bacterium]
MPRRFLTVEDLLRSGKREVVVDADTIVTPQALDAAAAHGITITTSSGAYTEPAPDRGPDAERAQRTLPHLPESDDAANLPTGVVVTAVGKNRPGVLGEITGALAEAGANVHDISQKVVEGYFHLLLTIELPSGESFAAVKAAIECLGGPDDYVVRVMHERVFRFMHRV